MRPNKPMVTACRRALAWHTDFPDARELVEPWMIRFARSVIAEKQWATVLRVHNWFTEHGDTYQAAERFFNNTDPAPERVAYEMMGGDAGRAWARDAIADTPTDEQTSIRAAYEPHIEQELAVTDPLTLPPSLPTQKFRRPAGQEMAAEDWADPDVFAAFEGRRPEWSGVLGLEGVHTSDNRIIAPGGLTWRDLPLTLQDQILSQPGHDGATAAGPIINIWREPSDGNDTMLVRGEGLFDSGDDGMAARRRMEEGTKQGVSLDLTEVELDLPEDEDEMLEVLMGGGELRISSARIGAATLVTIPAFEGARLQIIGDIPEEMTPEALVASGGRVEGMRLRVVTPVAFADSAPAPLSWSPISVLPVGAYPGEGDGIDGVLFEIDEADRSLLADIREALEETEDGANVSVDLLEALLASGGTTRPPSSWFDQQSYGEPTPFTMEDPDEHGLRRIHGHLGLKGSCHIGFADKCVDVPMGLNYESFQGKRAAGTVSCSDGVKVKAGPIVMSTEHAPVTNGNGRTVKAGPAIDHYAHTGCMVAQGRCYEDRFGVQVQGWVLPGANDAQLAVLDAADASPDWRFRGDSSTGTGVMALLVVGVSGFNTALAASAGTTDETEAEPVAEPVVEPVVLSWETTRDEAAVKVALLERAGVPAPAALVAAAGTVEDPGVSARKTAALARLTGVCGCGGDCCGP